MMKTLIAILSSVFLCATSPAADVAAAAKTIDTLFKAKEVSFETAFTGRTEDLSTYDKSVTFGLNYWVTAGAGLHAGLALNDLNGQGVDLVEFGLTGRVPLDKIRTAFQFGIGAEHRFVYDRTEITEVAGPKETRTYSTKTFEDTWAVYAEAGPIFRLHEHLDIFFKVRGVRPIESAAGEHIAILIGADIPFSF